MKNLITLFFSLLVIGTNAQPLSGSFSDCNNRTEDIQATLGTGKALIIAHKGVDCSICVSQAPSFETWAAANSADVAVWCALTYKYNPNNFSNPCVNTASWVSRHSWSTIFTFPDNARQFINIGTPRYYVYSPRDSTIKYSGSNRTQAYNVALAESIVSVNEIKLEDKVEYKLVGDQLQIDNATNSGLDLRVFDLKGRLILEERINGSSSTIQLGQLNKSIYLVQFSSSEAAFSSKILVQ